MSENTVFEYDATQDTCPVPLVKMRLMLKKMVVKDILILKIADSGSKKDIPRYLSNKQYHYVTKNISLNVNEITIYQR